MPICSKLLIAHDDDAINKRKKLVRKITKN